MRLEISPLLILAVSLLISCTTNRASINQDEMIFNDDEIYADLLDPETEITYGLSPIALGRERSPVIVVSYLSISCTFCRDYFFDIFENLQKNEIEQGRVKYVYHQFARNPVDEFAVKLVECANRPVLPQDRRLDFISRIYEEQNNFKDSMKEYQDGVLRIAQEFLSDVAIQQCMDSTRLHERIVNTKTTAVNRYKITNTPTIFINGKKLVYPSNYQSVRDFIEEQKPRKAILLEIYESARDHDRISNEQYNDLVKKTEKEL